ncbi:hypothetical protein PVN28_21785, partial [Bacillus licheniformis]|nr:hypothetical protein [Bacillus licheniformis]
MKKLALLKEGKIPADNRVALTPAQCKLVHESFNDVQVVVQRSADRCFSDAEYARAGIQLADDVHDCDILVGIK